jgi:hypothetical protein
MAHRRRLAPAVDLRVRPHHTTGMTTTPEGIEKAELIESIFGGWPSFHDAEIHDIVITRDCDSGSQMDIKIHHWQGTGEVDATGHYVSVHHTLTTFRFVGLDDLDIVGFNQQNVISDLEILAVAEPDSGFSVSMRSLYGCGVTFKCRRICVLSALPYTKT